MAHVQLAPDSTGKKVVMEEIVFPDGTTGYRQIAVFGGETLLIFQQLLEESRAQTMLLRGIFKVLNESSNSQITEGTF